MQTIIWNSILDKYFDETTMSLHIKVNSPIVRKKGEPGNWKPIVDTQVMNKEDFTALIDALYQEIESRDDGFLEIDRKLSKVMQVGPYRIVIVYPPLSDGLEMTVVKPIRRLSIEDYKLDEETFDLLKNKSKGILVSWAPGSGKTTFAQALIDVYHKENAIIKTIESPRDLQVSDDIVQYSFTYGTHDEVRDILLLSRPDYTIYDEVRNKSDFELYKDLRLTGIGLVGVIHATRPVDSIQRFLGTIEMGIIPQVIDTVIYIEKGLVNQIYQLALTVKIPDGMMSEDMARPVIVVSSFLTKKVEYEIYTFGEQNVVMPIAEWWMQGADWGKKNMVSEYAKQTINQKLQKILPCDFLLRVKGTSLGLYIPEEFKGRIIGKAGASINDLEKSIGLRINVKLFADLPLLDVQTQVDVMQKNAVMITFPEWWGDKEAVLIVGEDLFRGRIDTHGVLAIKEKAMVKLIQKKWYVIVDIDKL